MKTVKWLFIKIAIIAIVLLLFSSCRMGYITISDEAMYRREKISKKVEDVADYNFPNTVRDTLLKWHELYNQMKKLDTLAKDYNRITYFIAFDTAIQGAFIKCQDFYSEELKFPFGYFFRFGKKKFYKPYERHGLTYPYIYYDDYLYIPQDISKPYEKWLGVFYWRWKIKL